MVKSSRTTSAQSKARKVALIKSRPRSTAAKSPARAPAETPRVGWATDLVFDVREPKLAVSLRTRRRCASLLPRIRRRLSDPDQRGAQGVHASPRRIRIHRPCRRGRQGIARISRTRQARNKLRPPDTKQDKAFPSWPGASGAPLLSNSGTGAPQSPGHGEATGTCPRTLAQTISTSTIQAGTVQAGHRTAATKCQSRRARSDFVWFLAAIQPRSTLPIALRQFAWLALNQASVWTSISNSRPCIRGDGQSSMCAAPSPGPSCQAVRPRDQALSASGCRRRGCRRPHPVRLKSWSIDTLCYDYKAEIARIYPLGTHLALSPVRTPKHNLPEYG